MVTLCWRPVSESKPSEIHKLEDLRCELATLVGAWPTSLSICAERVLAACNCTPTLVSILGASQNGRTLAVLGSCGPDAVTAPAGRVLPTPWLSAVSEVEPTYKNSCEAPHTPALPAGMITTLTWKSGSQLTLPYEWHQILGQTRFAETMSLHATLEPLTLNRRLVGALLVVSYAGALPQCRNTRDTIASAPFVSPVTWTGGERADGPPAVATKASSFLKRFKKPTPGAGAPMAPAAPSAGLLRGLASVLSQAAIGPHLRSVSRVCSAAQSLAAAASLQEFASILTYTVIDSLAADLHITLAVRVAVVPPLYGQHGFLLPSEESHGLSSNADSFVKRAVSAVPAGLVSPRALAAARTISGRGCSFSGQSPASASNVVLSAPSNLQPKADSKAISFALPSALLMQLLRPANRANASVHASTHASTHAGSCYNYYTEEPTVRSIVIKAAGVQPSEVLCSDAQHADIANMCSVTTTARDTQLQMQCSGVSASGASASLVPARNGGGGPVAGVVVANLNAWMQDIERPSSDVSLLMLKNRSPTPGRMSHGDGGMGSGSACLVVVAGSAAPRGGDFAAAAAVANGSAHATRVSKQGRPSNDWVRNLEASLRGGVAVDFSARGLGCPGGYGGGSVKFDSGVSCGPCVALYITAQERLPTSLLRAVKDRAQALLELLLPACLSSLSMGPVRADVEQLVSGGSPANTGHGSRRNLISAMAAAATPAPSAYQTPVQFSAMSASQLQLPMSQVGICQPSPPASVAADMLGGASSMRLAAGISGLSSNTASPVGAQQGALDSDITKAGDAGGVGNGSVVNGVHSPVTRSADMYLLAHQKWPEPTAQDPCKLPKSLTAPLSAQSRNTRGSPGSETFGLGAEASIMASMDVTSGFDDMVTSMRDNLDVWVNSFWEMLRESPVKAGNTPGSYADTDLRFLRLYQRLGSGGAASVFAGMLLGMDVAVKLIHPPPEVDMDALASARASVVIPHSGTRAQPQEAGSGGVVDMDEEEAEVERLASLAAAVRQAQMRELMRSARECAVLTTLSHPAIVQVYSYHTKVQVMHTDGPDGLPRLVPVPPSSEQSEGTEAQGPLHSVLIMERCDLGSLADALDSGMFKKAILTAANVAVPSSGRSASRPNEPASRRSEVPSTFSFTASGGGSAMHAIYLTLLEVALALRHLHSLNLVHCDVKVANVLLKSSASDPRGFTCKLSDFGLVNLLQTDEQREDGGKGGSDTAVPSGPVKPCMRNEDAAGTVTHLSPECFTPGSKLDQSVDIYAFGIVMWEVFTRKPPYAEFAPDFEELPTRVIQGVRLRFPSHCPAPFKALAQACWSGDASRRPTAASVVTCLQHLLEGGQHASRV